LVAADAEIASVITIPAPAHLNVDPGVRVKLLAVVGLAVVEWIYMTSVAVLGFWMVQSWRVELDARIVVKLAVVPAVRLPEPSVLV